MSFIIGNFDLWTEQAKDVQMIKQLVLDLAVKGMLVEQGEEDEGTGKELLENLFLEKGKLDLKPKTKKSSLKQSQSSFIIPKNWIWSDLESVTKNVHYGFTASANPAIKDVRLLRITDIQKNKVNWESVPGCEIKESDLPKYRLNENDILIARTGGTVGKSYLVKGVNLDAVFASYLIRAIPLNGVFPDFIKLYLQCPFYWQQITDKSSGTGQPNVNATALKSLKLPLPPLPEQHRIVQRVNSLFQKIDTLAAQSQRAQSIREKLRTALLHQLDNAKNAAAIQTAWEALSGQMETVFDSVAAVKELRKSILQLAVKGKLVEQREEEESAVVLLKRIREEKARMVKEGEIKKQKLPKAISKSEIPHDLPKGWDWCRLMNLGYFTGGGTPSKHNPQYWNGEILWVSSRDLKSQFITDTHLKITQEGIDNSSANLIPKNSILIGARTGILRRLLPVCINAVECSVNQDIKVLVPYVSNIYEYIQLMLKGFEAFILKELVKQGTTVESLKYTEFQNHPFPLPPLPEQHRIVEKVNQLMSVCDRMEALLTERAAVKAKLLEKVLG